MPLVFEEDGRGAMGTGAGFDLQTASTLFWKAVPVSVRSPEREDQTETLTFRILTGVLRSNHNMRVLRIHISSESDLYFLHTLEVSEEDFQSLKNEQGILVDFASFPGKIITLLDRCIAQQPTDAPRFQAVLSIRGTESVFKIVETNDFKQLPHITLAFRPGNDAAIKQFLAFRLLEVKGNLDDLSQQLTRMTTDRDSTSSQLASTRKQLAELKEQYDKTLLEVKAEAKTAQAAAHEERIREKGELKDAHDRELASLQRRLGEQVDGLNTRVAELDAENRRLREAKYELDKQVSELSHRLGSSEGSNKALEEEVARLRSDTITAAQERAQREAAAAELKSKLLALEEKATAQAEVIEQQRSRVRDLEASVRQLDGRCSDLRDVSAGHDQRAKDAQAEVLKGNQVIEKLTNDLRVAKEKVKRKQAIIVRQEEELGARDSALATASREAQVLSQNIEALKTEVSSLRSENADLRAKLEDSKTQLQSNEQMIRWLNQQVTEAQLGGSGAVPGSRYSLRGPTSSVLSLGPPPGKTPAAGGGVSTAAGLTGGMGTFSYASQTPMPHSSISHSALQAPMSQAPPSLGQQQYQPQQQPFSAAPTPSLKALDGGGLAGGVPRYTSQYSQSVLKPHLQASPGLQHHTAQRTPGVSLGRPGGSLPDFTTTPAVLSSTSGLAGPAADTAGYGVPPAGGTVTSSRFFGQR